MDNSSKGMIKGAVSGHGAKATGLERVKVGDLEMGAFIAELDRPWLETPFPLQGFELRDEAELRILEKYCQSVYVSRELPVLKEKPKTFADHSLRRRRRSDTEDSAKQSKKIISVISGAKAKATLSQYEQHRVAVREEHRVAKKAYRQGKVSIQHILASARLGQMLNTESAQSVVSSCVESMLTSPDAMLWMSKMKHEDEYTAEHCLNVCVLAIAFGRFLNFSTEKLKILGLCGLLHDVGKMRTPDEILNKRSSLTDEEFLIIKQHTVEGHQLLIEEGGAPAQAIDVALNHHERPDGKGYPNGLSGDDISEYSRIIAIVDAYDAITSDRCYSRAVSPVEAQKMIYRNRGKQFDEKYVLQFMQAIGPYPPGTLVELHNGMVGIVLSGRRKIRHLPTTIIVRNADKHVIDETAADLYLTTNGELDSGYLIRRSLKDGAFDVKLEDYVV